MTALGHLRPSIRESPTDGLPSTAEGQCPARTIGSSTPTSGPTPAVAGTDGSCQEALFGRRPHERVDRYLTPTTENLHNSGHSQNDLRKQNDRFAAKVGVCAA
jgi:hypothetical protein